VQLQLSAVNAIAVTDINQDGQVDIIAAGNQIDMLPQFCSLDAGYGNVVINKGNRKFEALLPSQSGLLIKGVVRDIQPLQVGKERLWLFLQNNNYPLLYRPSTQ
jgi:hypothetical protein